MLKIEQQSSLMTVTRGYIGMLVVIFIGMLVGIALSIKAGAQTAPSATINVNGQRSSVLPYGSNAILSWNSSQFTDCTVTPGDRTDLKGSKELTNITTSQTY